VSQGTVSNVFTGRARVREDTRQRVVEGRGTARLPAQYLVARASGWARAMAVGLCLSVLNNPALISMIEAIELVFREARLPRAHLHDAMERRGRGPTLEYLAQQQVAGVINSPSGAGAEHYRRFIDRGTPASCSTEPSRAFPAARGARTTPEDSGRPSGTCWFKGIGRSGWCSPAPPIGDWDHLKMCQAAFEERGERLDEQAGGAPLSPSRMPPTTRPNASSAPGGGRAPSSAPRYGAR